MRNIHAILLQVPLVALVLLAGTAGISPAGADNTVLSAIEALESQHDARCHSTASRFEDFLFGTPLSAEARHAHTTLQKRLAARLWSTAFETPVGGKASWSARNETPAIATGPQN